MEKVLIPIGYHPVSEKIVKEGVALAKKLNAKVCLMHVIGDIHYYNLDYPGFMGYVRDPGLHSEEDSVAKNVAEEFLGKTASDLKEEVQTQVKQGETATAILEYAKEWNADIIVLGTHSRGVLKKVFMGSKAHDVLEHTEIPVYMVPVKRK